MNHTHTDAEPLRDRAALLEDGASLVRESFPFVAARIEARAVACMAIAERELPPCDCLTDEEHLTRCAFAPVRQ